MKLKKDDAAIVFHRGGSFEGHIPEHGEDDYIESHEYLCCGIMMLIAEENETLFKLIDEVYERGMKKAKETL